jgi:DNA-binding transcriptional LysR family regulator
MQLPDMNLLPALDALLREGSVAGAAAETGVSASAMSRTLGRLRRVVGDPLLVRSGRGLQLTARARELQPQVQAALAAALAALRPPAGVELATLEREFVIRTNDGVAMTLGPALIARCAAEAPGIRLRLVPEGDEDPADLRRDVDLDIGALPPLPPDVRSRDLVEYRYVAVARDSAPYARQPLSVERFAALPHITTTRRGRARSVVDERLASLGLRRDVLATVPTYGAACYFVLESDALALVPAGVAEHAAAHLPLAVLDIPLDLPSVRLGMAWHLRLDTDPAHRWLRRALTALAHGHPAHQHHA